MTLIVYENKSASNGAQLGPIGMTTVCSDPGSHGEHITNTIIIVTHNEKTYIVC